MESISTSIILLILAILLLWMAVTDRLSRVLDAWDVVTGKTTAAPTTTASGTPFTSNPITVVSLPNLPVLSMNSAPVPAV